MVYIFWENNFDRAYQFALEKKERGKIEEVAVIGAVIDLGYCLDFINSRDIKSLEFRYRLLKAECVNSGTDLPQNVLKKEGIPLLRNLDCAVIQRLHQWNKDNDYREYDSVRGVFLEGKEIYPTSEFREKNHIQICVRNSNCIKGYFSPLVADENYSIP